MDDDSSRRTWEAKHVKKQAQCVDEAFAGEALLLGNGAQDRQVRVVGRSDKLTWVETIMHI